MASREFNIKSQTEHLQAKYVGTGHADLTRHEWAVNQHRDTYASLIGHPSFLSYFSLARNEPIARLRTEYFERMVQPCGPPPPKEDPILPSSTQS